MTRILNLQAMTSYRPVDDEAASTSSGNGCACSTNSAALCFMGDEVVAI
jgi:hypothetical protein